MKTKKKTTKLNPTLSKLLMFQLMVVAKTNQIHQLHNQRRNDLNQLRKQLPNRQFLQLNHLRENLQFQQPEKLHPCQNFAILVQLQRSIEIIWIISQNCSALLCQQRKQLCFSFQAFQINHYEGWWGSNSCQTSKFHASVLPWYDFICPYAHFLFANVFPLLSLVL